MKTLESKIKNKKTLILLREFIRLLEKEGQDINSINILSQYAHKDQKRRTGEPYFLHPQEVSLIVKKYYPSNEIAYYSALLHDALEDSIDYGNFEDENELMAFIMDSVENEEVGSRIIEVVSTLTKAKGAAYESYMSGVINDPDALIVKLADMLHNLSDNPSDRQMVKYGKAVRSISEQFQGKPSFINDGHWNELIAAIK